MFGWVLNTSKMDHQSPADLPPRRSDVPPKPWWHEHHHLGAKNIKPWRMDPWEERNNLPTWISLTFYGKCPEHVNIYRSHGSYMGNRDVSYKISYHVQQIYRFLWPTTKNERSYTQWFIDVEDSFPIYEKENTWYADVSGPKTTLSSGTGNREPFRSRERPHLSQLGNAGTSSTQECSQEKDISLVSRAGGLVFSPTKFPKKSMCRISFLQTPREASVGSKICPLFAVFFFMFFRPQLLLEPCPQSRLGPWATFTICKMLQGT